MLPIGRVPDHIATPRPPRGALSARFVSTSPASDDRGGCGPVCTGRRGGERDDRALGAEDGCWCVVKYGETEAEGMRSDTLI